MSSLKFEEQQQFRQRWVYMVYVLLFALLVLFIYADIEQIIFGRLFGDKPASNFVLILLTLFILSLLVLLYYIKLETLISDEGVCFRWRPFQKTYRKFDWGEIGKAEIINYGFVGYGWRLTPYGTIYNVAGDTGLQLHLKSGKKVVLGTQKANELADFLRQINRLGYYTGT
ncbi:MAG TPA: hypothetical protein VNS32_03025, partial [Flavisolibacter sp.]|nr:hypothetical protein [Flavisolibacter sp.]